MLRILFSLPVRILLLSVLYFWSRKVDNVVNINHRKISLDLSWKNPKNSALLKSVAYCQNGSYGRQTNKFKRRWLPAYKVPTGLTSIFSRKSYCFHFYDFSLSVMLQSFHSRNSDASFPFLSKIFLTKLASVRRPIYRLQKNGSISIEEMMPPIDRVLEGWDDIIEDEKASWKKLNNSEDKVLKRFRKLTKAEEFNKRLMEMRHFTQEDEEFRAPKSLPRFWIVRPKSGAYCNLMKGDLPRLKSLVSKIRMKYTAHQLEIVNVTMDVRMPLCEIFFTGPIPEEKRIFYARGGTLQADCAPRFWTYCSFLYEDSPLYYKYGGNYCPGLFPQWDEQGILEELDDCMNQPATHAMRYPLNWDWNNPGALTPENEQEREWWYTNVHWPTRQMVQSAFEKGVEDFREVIAFEAEQLEKNSRSDS